MRSDTDYSRLDAGEKIIGALKGYEILLKPLDKGYAVTVFYKEKGALENLRRIENNLKSGMNELYLPFSYIMIGS